VKPVTKQKLVQFSWAIMDNANVVRNPRKRSHLPVAGARPATL